MKNLKKMLSVFVVIAMLATTMLPAFAAETAAPKTEAEIAGGLGVVKGGDKGITEDYLKASTQRYQAAIIYLRLLGLEETAKVFAGKENFTDAKVLNTDMQKYLAYLKANPQYGWVGSGNGKFDPTSVVSPQQFYKVLLESLGYKCTVGTVKGDFDYNNTIAFAAEKGLTKVASVTKFTNADLISAVLEALAVEKKDTGKTLLKTLVDAKVIAEDVAKQYLPAALEVKKNVTAAVYSVTATNGELKVVLTEDVGTAATADFTVTQAINGAAATTVTGSVYEYTYTTKTAVIKVPAVAETATEQNVVFSVKYKDTTAVAAPAVVVGASFGIKEVVEPNLKTVKVNLNKDYDSAKDAFTVYKTSDTAATVAVTAKAVTGNTKQVLLVATGKFEADVDYTVKVTRDSKDYTKTFKVAADVSVPQLASVKAIGNKIIRVVFTEPVDNAAAKDTTPIAGQNVATNDYNYKIGDKIIGTDYAVSDIKASDDLTSVDITLTNALDSGEYTFAVIRDTNVDVIDYAGYYVPAMSAKFTVSPSQTAAQVKDVTVNSRSEVTVDFTDAIAAPAASYVYWNTDGEESTSSKVANAFTKVTDTSYKFSFTTNVIPTGKVYFFVKGAADAFGNSIPTKKIEKTVAADSVATTTITVENENTVKVKFSKDIQNGTDTNSGSTGDAANKSHYTIKKADGTAVEITTAKYVPADKTTTLTLKDKQSGACTISISGIKDVVGQEIQAVSAQSITFTDVTAPTVANVYVSETADGSGSNKIYIEFSEDMLTTGAYSVLTAGNYKWAQDADTNDSGSVTTADAPSYAALPDGTTIAVSSENSKAVIITLPSDKKAFFDKSAADKKITAVKFGEISGSTIKAVADKAGNILAIATTVDAKAEPTATIDQSELKITSATTLRVKVTGKNLSTVAASDFNYKTDKVAYTAPSSAKLVMVDGVQYVELTVPADTFTSNTDLNQVFVKTINPTVSSTTALGVKLASNVTSAKATSTSFTTSIKSVTILNANNVIVILEGNVSDATPFANSVLLSQGTTNLKVTGGALVGSTAQSNVVKLTTDGTIDETGSVTLKTKPTADIIAKDVNSQYIVTDTTGKTGTKGFMAESIAITESSNNVTKIVITFNQVPKLPDSKVVTSAVGKVTVADVGEITGLGGTAADVSAATVTVDGKSIVIDAITGTATSDPSSVLFTANANLKNTGSTAVNTDVKVLN